MEYLLGSTARLGDIIVLGLLTQLKEVHLLLVVVWSEIYLVVVETAIFLQKFYICSIVYHCVVFHCAELMENLLFCRESGI